MKKPEVMPTAVVDAVNILEARLRPNWPKGTMLKNVEATGWDSINGNYSVWIDSVYYGIELDGYVHT